VDSQKAGEVFALISDAGTPAISDARIFTYSGSLAAGLMYSVSREQPALIPP